MKNNNSAKLGNFISMLVPMNVEICGGRGFTERRKDMYNIWTDIRKHTRRHIMQQQLKH